jgi:hypothetical protein
MNDAASKIHNPLSGVNGVAGRFGLWLQPVDATHSANFLAGVPNCSVFRGRSVSLLATAFNEI